MSVTHAPPKKTGFRRQEPRVDVVDHSRKAGAIALPGLATGSLPKPLAKPREQDRQDQDVRGVEDLQPVGQLQQDDVVGQVLPHPELVSARVRPVLSPKELLTVLHSSAFLKSKLGGSTHAQLREAKGGAKPETVGQRLALVLAEVDKSFGNEPEADAMALAVAIDKVAGLLASELFDTALRPGIADDLFAVYGPKLETALAKKKVDKPQDQVKLARILAAVDPVSLYMHGEKRLQDAAWEIKDAAAQAGKKPAQMYELYRKRFEAEMASYTVDKIDAQESTDKFNLGESAGELSTVYFKRLFGDNLKNGRAERKGGGNGLAFAQGAQAQLALLEKEVLSTAPDTRPKTAEDRRKQLFAEVRQSDDDVKDLRERQVIEALQTKTWGLSQDGAKKVVAKLRSKDGLAKIPLTITHWAGRRSQFVKEGEKVEDISRGGDRKAVSMAGVIGKKRTKAKKALGTKAQHSIGKYEDPIFGGQRGERYMQFRSWKDRIMTGNMGFEAKEMPIYGAMNINFERYGGTGGVMFIQKVQELRAKRRKGKLTREETAFMEQMEPEHERLLEVQKDQDQSYGVNYYGDMHLKLKRDLVEPRVLYTAGDHGVPHRDPFLAFADFLVGTVVDTKKPENTYYSDRTGLKRGKDDLAAGGVRSPTTAKAILATILGASDVTQMELPFEIQIHGGVDWEKDVEEIWLSPSAPKDAFDHLTSWSTKPGTKRPPVKRMKRPTNIKVVSNNQLDLSAFFAKL